MEKQAVYERLGGNIRRARECRELNQGELADLIGMTRTSITNLETGRQGLQVHQLLLIARALNMSVDDLLDESVIAGPRGDTASGLESLPGNLAAVVQSLQRRVAR